MKKEVIINVDNITKRINKTNLLDGFTFKVIDGEILGLLGPNGSGKTTLIRTILGLMSIDQGTISIYDKSIKNNFEEIISKVGAIVEKPCLYEHLSGNANLKIFADFYTEIDNEYIESLIDIFELRNDLNKRVSKYSLGMKQRLALIISLINKPKILILDEPTNGLDPVGIVNLRRFLITLNQTYKTTIIISSHILSEIEVICDRAIVINKGKLIKIFDIKDLSMDEKYYKISTKSSDEASKIVNLLEQSNINIIEKIDMDILISIDEEKASEIISEIYLNGLTIVSASFCNKSLEDDYFDLIGGVC